jgi:hypothetical protein
MTVEERAHVIQQLKDSEQEYLASIGNVTEAQWKWKPAPDMWSVGETAEHIMQAEVVIFRRLQHAIQAPPSPDCDAKTEGKTEMLGRVMLNRSQKATAPEITQPQGLPREEIVRRFRELRAQIIGFAQATQLPLQAYAAEHPFPTFNTLNAFQWLLLIPLHQMRHVHQIAEIKAAPGYPK